MEVVKNVLALLLLYAFLSFKGSDNFYSIDNVVYVSSTHGAQSNSCGSMALPCKALQVGIDKLAWGGLLYIDGGQTATNPYSCDSSSGKVVAKKSLHVRSYNTMAHISCPNGFRISADNGSIGMDVTISGMQFKNTALYLRNVSNVTIQDCTFLESSPAIDDSIACYNGSPIFFSLRIKRTLFKRNRGCMYFQLQFDSKNKVLNRAILDLTNVTFEENIAGRDLEKDVKVGLVFVKHTNCNHFVESMWENVIAIRNSIGNTTKSSFRPKETQDPILNSIYAVHACNASIKFIQVRSNYNNGLRFLGVRSRHSSVRIYKSCFHGHRIRGPGGVMYIPNGHLIDVVIRDSVFTKNFASVGGAIHIDEGESFPRILQFSSCVLIIEKSTYLNNSGSIYLQINAPRVVNIEVRDTIIKDNIVGKQVFLEFGNYFVTIFGPNKMAVQVIFERVSIISNLNNQDEAALELFLIKVPVQHDGHFSFVFRQSVFRDNFFNLLDSGSRNQEKSLLHFATLPYVKEDKNTLTFNEVIFENNTSPYSIVYITSGFTSFFNKCLFKNNYSHRPNFGAHLYITEGKAYVELNSTTFLQTANYFKTYGANGKGQMLFMFACPSGPLSIKNSKFVAEDSSERVIALLTIQSEGLFDLHRVIDNLTELLCPVGSLMNIEDKSHSCSQKGYYTVIIRLKFICEMCAVGKYSLERGSYKGQLSSTNCIQFCPFGAECTWNIQSRPNFWGYYTSRDPPQLNFTRCHEKYCHVPKSLKTNTSAYNACFGNRSGIMCGACKEGFTESMFNHKCRPSKECRDVWFWVIAGLYSTIMACYFLFQPPVMLYLVNSLLWFRKKKPLTQNSAGGEESEGHGGHGYSKIVFYFYQVADLLMLESASEILHSYNFISSVISLYNFQIEMADSKLGCPFPGLTAVTKEIFRSAQVFTVMTLILVFYLLHCLLRLFKSTPKPSFAPYLAAIVEILLLGYERLGHASLKLLNCVPIKIRGIVEWRLVLDGNTVCWSNWWQYCLIAYNIIFVIPFLLVLLIGTSRLRRQRITAIQFVAACFLPLPFVTYWLLKICFRRKLNESNDNFTQSIPENSSRKALLEVLQEPFRPPDHQSRGAYYWESILIGRRLIFLCLYSFVSTPMLRMLFMTAVCVAIPFHNVIVMPYKERRTNIFGIMMLFMHVVLATINLCKSVFITIGVTVAGPTRSQIDGLQFFEAALLGFLPCMLVILVVATVISQVFRFSVLILCMIQRCIMHFKRISEINNGVDVYGVLSNPLEEDSNLYGDIQ